MPNPNIHKTSLKPTLRKIAVQYLGVAHANAISGIATNRMRGINVSHSFFRWSSP